MVAWSYSLLGDPQQAIQFGEQAVRVHRLVGDISEEGLTWASLGYAYHQARNSKRALACYYRALEIFDRVDHRWARAETLNYLGDAYRTIGEPKAARQAWRAALDLSCEMDHPNTDQLRAKLYGLVG